MIDICSQLHYAPEENAPNQVTPTQLISLTNEPCGSINRQNEVGNTKTIPLVKK